MAEVTAGEHGQVRTTVVLANLKHARASIGNEETTCALVRTRGGFHPMAVMAEMELMVLGQTEGRRAAIE